MGKFGDSFLAFEEKALLQANTSVSNVAKDLFTKVVSITPSVVFPGHWAKGHLANQYYLEWGGSFSSEISNAISDNGNDSLTRIQVGLNTLGFYKKDNVVTFTNNVDYAYRAEHIGWLQADNPRWKNRTAYKMISISINYIKGKYT